MEMPIGEFLDRFSIISLKYTHLGSEVEEEFRVYNQEFHQLCSDHPEWAIPSALSELMEVNRIIWEFESDLRQGKLGEYDDEGLKDLPFSELVQLAAVGQAAINIRNTNLRRKRIVNEIVEVTGSGFRGIKINHASEEVQV